MVRSASSATVSGVIAAAGLYGRGAPRADRSGNHHHDVEQIQRAAFEVLDGDVFKRLPARPQVHAIAHLGIAGHRADLRIGKVADQARDRVVRDHAVGVDADIDLFVDLLQREIQRLRLAAVRLGQHGERGPRRSPSRRSRRQPRRCCPWSHRR